MPPPAAERHPSVAHDRPVRFVMSPLHREERVEKSPLIHRHGVEPQSGFASRRYSLVLEVGRGSLKLERGRRVVEVGESLFEDGVFGVQAVNLPEQAFNAQWDVAAVHDHPMPGARPRRMGTRDQKAARSVGDPAGGRDREACPGFVTEVLAYTRMGAHSVVARNSQVAREGTAALDLPLCADIAVKAKATATPTTVAYPCHGFLGPCAGLKISRLR